MAVDLLSENSSMVMSPRISFSHDLSQSDVVPVEQILVRSNSSASIDFDFCVFRESFEQECSSADELFSDGKILPIQIKKRIGYPKRAKDLPPPPPPPHPQTPQSSSISSSNEAKMAASETDEKHNTKSFWGFKRSISLNCGSVCATTLCPLSLLSRSNSTGSAQSIKRSSFSKDGYNQKLHSHKISSSSYTKQPQSSAHQKPPLKKNYGSIYGNGVKISPVLNLPTVNLFGLGTIFSSSRDKHKKK